MTPLIEPQTKVLFQGDSITDAGRGALDPQNLGSGYAMMAASWFSAAYPTHHVGFINRGVSGSRVTDLERRWERDCLMLRPDWVSIMIGINDTWRAFDSNDPTSIETYETAYRSILTQTVETLGAKLILMEPFVLPYPDDRKAWRGDLDARIRVVRSLAEAFDAILVPLDGIMTDAAEHRPPAFWTEDGVHPTPCGHALIAQAWLRAVNAIA